MSRGRSLIPRIFNNADCSLTDSDSRMLMVLQEFYLFAECPEFTFQLQCVCQRNNGSRVWGGGGWRRSSPWSSWRWNETFSLVCTVICNRSRPLEDSRALSWKGGCGKYPVSRSHPDEIIWGMGRDRVWQAGEGAPELNWGEYSMTNFQRGM